MRTVKRQSLPINSAKMQKIKECCKAYAKEKTYWFDTLKGNHYQSQLGSHRRIRDAIMQSKYISASGLQARHWKLALQDSVETWDKYWQALFVEVKGKIFSRFTQEQERHYAFWLLDDYSRFTRLLKGESILPTFPVEKSTCRKVSRYLRKIVRKKRGSSPKVHKATSVKFDADCYEVFEQSGRQYIKIMSLEKGKRILIPLLGKAAIQGNISLHIKGDIVEIHVPQEMKTFQAHPKGPIESVDFGFTEVMTDTENMRYGTKLGSILTKASDNLNEKMKKRNKLYALAKKFTKKAKTFRKYNLGKRKQKKCADKSHASISKEINNAINGLVCAKKPSILITEDLRARFRYNKSKHLNRKLSYWVRGEIQDRVSFKALAKGFRHEQVNPAYGSQTCPICGFVDKRNRKQDKFVCLYCKHEDVADRVAATNYAKRYRDGNIWRGMPPHQVKTVLLDAFHRRLEKEKSLTVPGRTLDTVKGEHPPPPLKQCCNRERETSKNRAVPQRAKQKEHV
jgi:IS605 OrfB family transposase